MPRIMLVDDEPIFINDLRDTIRSIGPEYEVVYEAFDGSDALKNIGKFNPDIIFTDIKMPGIDGITLIKEIKKIYKHIILIVLSGYQDFNLVRDALRASADDYLLKPVEKNLLHTVLMRASSHIQFLKKNYQTGLLKCIMKNIIPRDSDLLNYFSAYSQYCCCLIYPAVSVNDRNLTEIEKSLGDNETCWIFDQYFNECTLIIFGIINRISDESRVIGEKILKSKMPASVVVVSQRFSDIRRLERVVNKIKNEKDSYQVLGQSCTVVSDKEYLSDNTEIYNQLQSRFKLKLQNALLTHHWYDFSELIKKTFEYCQTEKISALLIKKFLFRITISVEKNYSILPQFTELNIENQIEKIVDESEDYQVLTREYLNFLCEIFSINYGNISSSDQELMLLIESYLKENITSKISVEEICRHFYISQTKMNRIFKKYCRTSFIDYLTQMKMEEAKALLRDQPDMPIAQIAYTLGFSDNLYFSKVFRKITEYSPSEFRKQYSAVYSDG